MGAPIKSTRAFVLALPLVATNPRRRCQRGRDAENDSFGEKSILPVD